MSCDSIFLSIYDFTSQEEFHSKTITSCYNTKMAADYKGGNNYPIVN